jgi:hypothetical protein
MVGVPQGEAPEAVPEGREGTFEQRQLQAGAVRQVQLA